MFKYIKDNFSTILSLLLSGLSIFIICTNTKSSNLDSASILVTVLGVLVTVLIAFQIANYFSFEERINKRLKDIDFQRDLFIETLEGIGELYKAKAIILLLKQAKNDNIDINKIANSIKKIIDSVNTSGLPNDKQFIEDKDKKEIFKLFNELPPKKQKIIEPAISILKCEIQI